MEPAPLLLLLVLGGCSGRPANKLSVVPREPVVRYGGSVRLNCSLACAGGTVQWRGLDTNLGSVISFPTHSLLHISRAVVATAGTKICQGTCHGRHYQHTADVKVYALPDTLQLESEPRAPQPGQPPTLRCAARGVYPLVGLGLTWYRGDRALGEADFDVTETEEELFDIVSTLPLAGKELGDRVEFRCEVTLSVGQETFTRVASVAASAGAVTEQLVATATSVGRPQTAVATTGTPSTARPVTTPEPRVPTPNPAAALATTPREPNAETTLGTAAATEPPSTAPQDLATGGPMAPPATAMLPGPGTASPPAQGTAAHSVRWGSAPAGTGQPTGTTPTCSLRIRSLPPTGTRGRALSIECQAQCGGNATVRWLRTPVALSQYREEAAGGGSTLRLDRAEPRHQGRYQCVLRGQRSPAASLQLRLSDGSPSPGPAIAAGSTASLLGLLVAGAASRRLWKRLRSQSELP
ncbi:mucosal addressin cell adhesion molecule 1 [Pterocles gutturalis]